MRRSTDPAAPVAVADAITLHVHGWSTHLDALGHIYTDGVGYNGRRRAEILTGHGLAANAIIAMKDGVFTRGVLLDVAACCGVPRLPTDHVITRTELQRAEDAAGVRVEACDALFVRTGLSARLAADTTDDPDGRAGLGSTPCCGCECVLALCAQLHRHEFLLTVAPLPIVGRTGSPVNPIATF